MPFTSDLDSRLIDDLANSGRGSHMLLAPLRFVDKEGIEYVVPIGYITDFASVPRAPIVFWLDGGTAHRPSALHDYLLTSAIVPRERADELFREAMESLQMPEGRIHRMYNAVRAFTCQLAQRANPWSDSNA